MMRLRWLPLALALASAGCIDMAPRHERPALSTEPVYDPEYRPEGAVDPAALRWQDYFADPRLKALIGSALANNRDLAAATARIEQARAQYRIQDSQRFPAPVASGEASRSRTPGDQTFGVMPSTQDRFSVGVAVTSFELDFWGRLANLSEAARSEYLATIAAQRAFRLSLISDVAETYVALVEAEEQIALAEATTRSREEGLRIANLRLDAGVTSALPYRQAETLLTQAQSQREAQRLEAARTGNLLVVLVGGRMPADLPTGQPLAEQRLAEDLDAGLPSRLLLARPDIIAAEERLRGARANIGAARAAFFPTISLTGTFGFASTALDRLFNGANKSWSYGGGVSLPIFDWRAREADLDRAKALRDEAVANYDSTVQQAFREVSDALAGRRWLADQVATQTRAVAAQEKIAHLARLRYREGVADYLEVLDAERNLFTAQQALLDARRTKFQNAVSLYAALGGGELSP